MDIITYRREKGLSQSEFAALLTEGGLPTTQSLVSQYESGATGFTPERAREIDRITKGEVSVYDLRPDLAWTRDRDGRITGYHVVLVA